MMTITTSLKVRSPTLVTAPAMKTTLVGVVCKSGRGLIGRVAKTFGCPTKTKEGRGTLYIGTPQLKYS
jgi:hypothetical protein